MKENTEITSEISQIAFSNFPSRDIWRDLAKWLLDSLKRRALSYKRQFFNGVATLGIGAILLISIYLFLIQLAENGWQ